MKTLIPAFLSFVAFGAPAATQQPAGQPAPAPAPATSEAETLFRDAWWAESGKNDFETALRGYLAAAAAEGPASVRAKALLHAAGSQQRLGKADAALDLYRKVLAEYATERASVDQARVHLRELTAVDLRQNYDEWYERRLFGEEIQLLILGKLEALTSLLARRPAGDKDVEEWGKSTRGLEAEILAFGKGAVPALQKACSGGHDESREHAIDMLFALGELPSTAALLSSQGWVSDPQHWVRLLAVPSATAVPASTAWHRPLLVAARQGASALLEAMLALRDPGLFDSTEIFTAITVALLQDAASQDATLLAMGSAATPLLARKAMERALIETEDGTFRLTARQWLDLSEDPLQFEVRILGTRRAANLIGKADEAILESLLHRAETAVTGRSLCTRAITDGLDRLVAPLDVPWTAARLRRLILLGQRRFEQGTLAGTLTPLHVHAPARAMLAEAMLTEPAAFVAAIMGIPEADRHESLLAEQVALPDGGEHDQALFCARWYAAMLSVLERDWNKWDDGNRAAAVWIVQRSLRTEFSCAVVRTFFDGKKAGAAQPVLDAIETLLAALPPG